MFPLRCFPSCERAKVSFDFDSSSKHPEDRQTALSPTSTLRSHLDKLRSARANLSPALASSRSRGEFHDPSLSCSLSCPLFFSIPDRSSCWDRQITDSDPSSLFPPWYPGGTRAIRRKSKNVLKSFKSHLSLSGLSSRLIPFFLLRYVYPFLSSRSLRISQ